MDIIECRIFYLKTKLQIQTETNNAQINVLYNEVKQ